MKAEDQKIKGYRELTQQEIDLINEVKSLGCDCQEMIKKLSTVNTSTDPRWVATGRTYLQLGLMALTRAIAQPENF